MISHSSTTLNNHLPLELIMIVLQHSDPLVLSSARYSSHFIRNLLKDRGYWKSSAKIHLTNSQATLNQIFNSECWLTEIIKHYETRTFSLDIIHNSWRLFRICPCDKQGQVLRMQISLKSMFDIPKQSQILNITKMFLKETCCFRVSCHDLPTGKVQGWIDIPGTVLISTVFEHEGNLYVTTIDETRALSICNTLGKSFKRIHKVQLPSNATITSMSTFPNHKIHNHTHRRRRYTNLPNAQSALDMFTMAKQVLTMLTNGKKLDFYPIWFDSMDTHLGSSPITYPLVERFPYFSLDISARTDKQVIDYWIMTLDDKWIGMILDDSGNVHIFEISLEASSLCCQWKSVILSGWTENTNHVDLSANLNLDQTSTDFLCLFSMTPNGKLHRWNLRHYITSGNQEQFLACATWTSCESVNHFCINWEYGILVTYHEKSANLIFHDILGTTPKSLSSMKHSNSVKHLHLDVDANHQKTFLVVKSQTEHIDIIEFGKSENQEIPRFCSKTVTTSKHSSTTVIDNIIKKDF